MRDTIAQTGFENVSKISNDPLLARGNTLQSGKDGLKLEEFMALCTNLQQRVLDLETTKTTQANEIASLKRRVKKLEMRNKLRTYGLKRLYKVGLTARVESSDDESLDDADMFDVNDLDGDEVIVANVDVVKTVEEIINVVEEVIVTTTVSTASTIPVSAATTTTTTIIDVEITLAQALAELKSAKPKADKVMIQEPEQGTTTTTARAKVQDKGKGIMVEPEKPLKKKDQISFDEETAKRLQAEFDEEERLVREKDEANVALTKEWDDIQAKIKADY
ncbi:hypothetical protein Tco_0947398 [Tanacetum coccineum]